MRFPGSCSSSLPDSEPQIALLSRIEGNREQSGAESVTRIWSISVFLFNPRERRPGEATRGDARRGEARGLLRREAGRSRPAQVTVSRFLLKKKKNNWAGGTTVATRGVPRERVRSFTGGRDTERERERRMARTKQTASPGSRSQKEWSCRWKREYARYSHELRGIETEWRRNPPHRGIDQREFKAYVFCNYKNYQYYKQVS